MSQNNGKWGNNGSVFTHPHPAADNRDLRSAWADVLEKNPGTKHLLHPDYQYNYYDPPHDVMTSEFINKINNKWPLRRHRLLKKFLPEQLYQFKSLLAKLPYSQLQQLREQVYIARIGDLGTNAPCTFSRQHWIYRVSNANEIVNSDTIRNLPTAELIRWYTTAVNNLSVDSAEEEYLRYKLCISNRLPLVNVVGPHNPTHYSPADGLFHPSPIPTVACRALLPMVHNAHRYFSNRINTECSRHFQPFYQALVKDRDLNESLISYERLQRCAIGREIRARVMTDKPHLVGVWQFFGKTLGPFFPSILTNWVSIRSNPVLEFSELDSDQLPIFNNQNLPKMKPLLDELRQELIMEGRMSPEPVTTATQQSFWSPFFSSPPSQTQTDFSTGFRRSNVTPDEARYENVASQQPQFKHLFMKEREKKQHQELDHAYYHDRYQITSPDQYPSQLLSSSGSHNDNQADRSDFNAVTQSVIKSNEELNSDKLIQLFNQQGQGRG